MRKRREIIWYHPNLKEQARELRNNCTKSEIILWNKLKGKQMMGYDFHRQKPIHYYIVDFFCNELRLAIEIDGPVHNSEEKQLMDIKRQEDIEEFGVKFLRFTDDEIVFNIKEVLSVISTWIIEYERKRD